MHTFRLAEGITAYYDEMLLRRAGLMSEDDILKTFRSSIMAYENKPGRLFQSVTQAVIIPGPTDLLAVREMISVKLFVIMIKGPGLGMLLYFKIRHETKNKKTLDDVMRMLYKKFYQQKKRGYTDEEFRKVCEEIAGVSLAEFFE